MVVEAVKIRPFSKWVRWSIIGIAVIAIPFTVYWATLPGNAEDAILKGRYSVAADLLAVRANSGDAVAQNMLGNLYYLGLGVERNQRLASKWYLASALANNGDAQINIARQYRLGYGLKLDGLRSYAWLRQARANNIEIAEVYITWLASRLLSNEVQVAQKRFQTLEDLTPSKEKGGL